MGKDKISCNACGRKLDGEIVNGNMEGNKREDALVVKKEWGYFSKKDLQVHEFVMCEQCYDEMVEKFSIKITNNEKKEVL